MPELAPSAAHASLCDWGSFHTWLSLRHDFDIICKDLSLKD